MQSQIEQIINTCYSNQSQQLNLFGYSKEWQDVINKGNWETLKLLILGNCRITDEKLLSIVKKKWPHLLQLKLFDNDISSQGIKSFIPLQLPKLKVLSLSYNNIGNEGVKWLTKMETPSLQTICLFSCKIGAEGMKHLAKGKWPMLKGLSMSKNNIGLDNSAFQANWQIKKLQINNSDKITKQFTDQPMFLMSFVTLKSNEFFTPSICVKNEQIKFVIKSIMQNRKIII